MLTFDETTLGRAAAAYGPFHLEHCFLQEYGRLNRAAGALAVRLVDLLKRKPVEKDRVTDALNTTRAAVVALYLALEQLEALFGGHPDGKASPFFSVHTALMNQLERDVRETERTRAGHYGCPTGGPAPDVCRYDKQEVLEMICTMAAREATEKEETHGTV